MRLHPRNLPKQGNLNVHLPEKYETRCPSAQNIVDLFDGEWTSAFPVENGVDVKAGGMALFDDPRITWAGRELEGFAGRSVLELGPLEAGHTHMMHHAGAAEIVAIEANRRAYLKCLCVKELYALDKARFLLGDFTPYLRQAPRRFDIVVASGVLYHMIEPMQTLRDLARMSDRLFLWTHYYDRDVIKGSRDISRKFGSSRTERLDGFSYEIVDYSYKEALNWTGFTGGTQAGSRWLTRAAIVEFLRASGYAKITVEFEQRDHPHGPAFALCAQR